MPCIDQHEPGGLQMDSNPWEEKDAVPRSRWCFWNVLPGGSRAAASFSLMKATLGAGSLAIPYTLNSAGIVWGVLLLAIMATCSALSIEMIVRAVHHTGKDTYEDLVDLLFGKRLGYLFQLAMIIFCFGTNAVYTVTIYDMASPVFKASFGEHPDTWYGTLFVDRVCFTTAVTLIILLPLSLVKTINAIRYLTFLGSLCVVFLAITSVYVISHEGVDPTFDTADIWKPRSIASLMAAFNTYIFAFANQPNVPEIYEELRDRTPRSMRQVTLFTITSCLGVYMVEGLLFFLAYGDTTESNILNNLGPLVRTGNPMVASAFLLMSVAIIGTYPLNVYPIRIAILHSLKPKKCEKLIGMVVATLTVALSYAVALALPDVNIILGLVGALAGSVICFVGPALFNVKISKKSLWCKDNYGYLAMVCIGIVAFVLGTYIAIVDTVHFYRNRKL